VGASRLEKSCAAAAGREGQPVVVRGCAVSLIERLDLTPLPVFGCSSPGRSFPVRIATGRRRQRAGPLCLLPPVPSAAPTPRSISAASGKPSAWVGVFHHGPSGAGRARRRLVPAYAEGGCPGAGAGP